MKNIRAQWAKVAIILVISLVLLWVSEDLFPATIFEPQSTGFILWISYASNLILPFVLYLLICLGEKWIKTWQWRALVAFAIPTLIEIGQDLYYRFSPTRYIGSFDLLDILMHAIGVGLAVLLEQKVLAKLFAFERGESSLATD